MVQWPQKKIYNANIAWIRDCIEQITIYQMHFYEIKSHVTSINKIKTICLHKRMYVAYKFYTKDG